MGGPVTTKKNFDIIVVGAGVLGLSCAYHLKRSNPSKDVLVVERFADVAQGNTARSNAMFRNTFTSWDSQILADTSINFYMDSQQSGVDLGLKMTGYLWVMSERQLSKNEGHVKKMEKDGIEIRRYDKTDLEKALPQLRTTFSDEESKLLALEEAQGAVFGVKCGRLDPDKLSRFYANKFRELGGKISLNTNVKSLIVAPAKPLGIEGEPFVWQESSVKGARLEGDLQGDYVAEKMVIAAGSWNNEILEPIGIDGHIKSKKRQLFKVPTGGDQKLRELMANKNFNELGQLPFIILPKSACYLKAVGENDEFWVGCEDDLGRAFVNIPDRRMENLSAEREYYERSVYPILKGYFPAFENSTLGQMWAGWYSYNTLDAIPFVFEEGGVIIAGGGSGSGIMKADSVGRIVDAAYRDAEEAALYGDRKYTVARIGFKSRAVEREEWVI
jgi:FAD-dependent oxidoreductase domain-containing protein 1